MRQPLTPAAAAVGPAPVPVVHTPSPTSKPSATPTLVRKAVPVMASTPVVSLSLATSLPTGGLQITLYPASNAVGWVSSRDSFKHFGERNLYVGVFEGNT